MRQQRHRRLLPGEEFAVTMVLMEQLSTPCTLRELCITLGPVLGDWPRETDLELVYVLNGHLRRMRERKLISARARTGEPHVLEFFRT